MCSAISIATCFTFFPGNEFGCLHDAFEKFVVEDWKDLSLEHTARPIVGGQPSSIFFKIISLCRSVWDERGLITDEKIPWTIYFTNADLTIRRPSGAILVIDRYEVGSISDGKTRFVLE
jgi:hypothetical protein